MNDSNLDGIVTNAEGAALFENAVSEAERKSVNEKLNGKINEDDKTVFGMENDNKSKMIGSKEQVNEDGLTEEQEKKLMKMYHDETIKRLGGYFRKIAEYMMRKNITLMQIHDEIDRKVCNLSSDTRGIVKGYKPEALMGFLKDYGIQESELGTKVAVEA